MSTEKWMKKTPTRTLFSRLVTIISGLTFSIVVLFTAATLLITYSFEDALFNDRLALAHAKVKEGEALPYNIQLIDSLGELAPNLVQQLRYFEFDQSSEFGEFSVEQRHYHYLTTAQGTLLYDTTDVSVVDKALNDVLLILLVLLIPTVLLTFWVANVSARYALKPFSQLSHIFTHVEYSSQQGNELIEELKEQDVKHIALELQQALQQKAELLSQQELFNQGMAHELRTPLQVMRNSVELLTASNPDLAGTGAIQRLEKSMSRMNRLSSGLLWLTSEQSFSGATNVTKTIKQALMQLDDACKVHGISVELVLDNNYDVAMPEEVLELIIFNLFNNVVHHGKAEGTNVIWHIEAKNKRLVFSNLAAEQPEYQLQERHFGIGLALVSRLTKRFSLVAFYQTNQDKFSAIISLV
ncbi:sensor histidine kinase [Thalassotalea euphylliae]|uniref:histidine kinase n=2 Tax=Thalassotalea euphylliae TaxID=1655234 RepID=A0A3E0TZA3_9GAMM|nr:sensor histidine kinase [Thalassotalea euphylliae]